MLYNMFFLSLIIITFAFMNDENMQYLLSSDIKIDCKDDKEAIKKAKKLAKKYGSKSFNLFIVPEDSLFSHKLI